MIVLISMTPLLFAEVPVRSEETLYSVAAFSGKDYALTFVKEDSPTLFLHSDASSFITLKKNFTYYWPLTEQWMVEDSVLDITYEGNIEIVDKKGNVTTLEPVDYTFFNVRGEYQNNWHVKTGKEAHNEWNNYVSLVLDYQEATTLYNRAYGQYKSRTTELFEQIMTLRGEGKEYDELLEQLTLLKEPTEPSLPTTYTVPPVKIQRGFQINLPKGEYSIRFATTDGNIVEGSEKKLVSIAPRRESSVGYEIFPAIRWSEPTMSTTASSVLYLDGSSDIYVRPFYQNEYLSLPYNKLINNQSYGNENLYSWVKIGQVPKSKIQLVSRKKVDELSEAKYIVEQAATSALGYSIVPYDPLGIHKGKTPTLSALYIPLSKEMKELSFSLISGEESSMRSIRIISGVHHEVFVALILFIPLLVITGLLIARKRRYKR